MRVTRLLIRPPRVWGLEWRNALPQRSVGWKGVFQRASLQTQASVAPVIEDGVGSHDNEGTVLRKMQLRASLVDGLVEAGITSFTEIQVVPLERILTVSNLFVISRRKRFLLFENGKTC